jgi:hypothetical protein
MNHAHPRGAVLPLPPSTLALVVLAGLLTGPAMAQSRVIHWGTQYLDVVDQRSIVQVSRSFTHTMAVFSDGSVSGWGNNALGQCVAPPLPSGVTYVEVAAGAVGLFWGHTVARRSDGSVVAWGDNQFGQCNVPPLPPGLTYAEVAAGYQHSLARRSDGAVVAWGDNSYGQCNVLALPSGLTYTSIAASLGHSMASRSDGSCVGWGSSWQVPPPLPVGQTYVDVEADGASVSAARRSDGSVVVWSYNLFGGIEIVPALPLGTVYIDVALGSTWACALRSDGMLVTWGDTGFVEGWPPWVPNTPSGWICVGLAGEHDCLAAAFAPDPGIGLQIHQNANGDLFIDNNSGPPSQTFLSFFSFDPLNNLAPGAGWLGGLHIAFADAFGQYSLGLQGAPPFGGVLNAAGNSSLMVPQSVVSPLSGLWVFGLTAWTGGAAPVLTPVTGHQIL